MTEAFNQALAALDAGDLGALRRVVAANPQVVHEVVGSREGIYAGYFADARLLHHVAGNPIRGPLPANIVEGARILIEAGADVNAPCGDPGTGDVLGLVASGALMAESGLFRPMIDLLLASGVDLARDRGVLSVCLYHTVECQQQREVGTYLASKGAKIDLVFAAALGRADLVGGFIDGRGNLTADAHGPFRADAEVRSRRDNASLEQEALTWACMNGQLATVAQLLELGAQLQGLAAVARWTITPLHAAAWGGWPSTCAYLLERGADVTALDPLEQSTPVGWARYCKRDRVLELFRRRTGGRMSLLDLVAVGELAAVEAALVGVDPNGFAVAATSPPGRLLREASHAGRADVVKLLLECGADPSLPNSEGKTALDWAVAGGHGEVAALLRQARG